MIWIQEAVDIIISYNKLKWENVMKEDNKNMKDIGSPGITLLHN